MHTAVGHRWLIRYVALPIAAAAGIGLIGACGPSSSPQGTQASGSTSAITVSSGETSLGAVIHMSM